MLAVSRTLSVFVTLLALAVGGCAAPSSVRQEEAAAVPSGVPTPTPSPVLDPPPQDGRVTGSLAHAAVPVPRRFLPCQCPGFGRTGPFSLRDYVRNSQGSKEMLADLRLSRMRRGWHSFGRTRDRSSWVHIYLFEARDNYGATTLSMMLFGSTNAASYVPRMNGALGALEHDKDDRGRYSAVRIAFVTGNVYAVVIVSSRIGRPDTRLAEQLASAQKQRLRAAMLPTA